MKPVNISLLTKALEQNLLNHALTQEVTVTRSEPINELPRRCPWIGIYRTDVRYPIRVLGAGPGARRMEIDLVLVVQAANAGSGPDCEEALETLISNVISALFDDVYLGGNCDTIDALEVKYTSYTQTENIFMQTAMVYFTALVKTT